MSVTVLLYSAIWILALFFLVRIIQKPELIYYFPYLMSFGFVVFILPQVYVIYEKQTFRFDAINRIFTMTFLCWIMCFIGWYTYHPKSFIYKNNFIKKVNENKLGIISAIFVTAGIAFNFLAAKIFQTTEFEGQQATGIVTIFAFFSQLVFIGTGLCIALGLGKKSLFIKTFMIIGIIYCFYIGLFQGKRIQTLYALFIVGVPLYLRYKARPPRVLVVAGLLVAFFLVPSMDQYRKALKTSQGVNQFISAIFTDIDYGKNLKEFYMFSESIELVNAGYEINHAYDNNDYRFGFDYWNRIVFRFVPSQLLGKEFKESLMLEGSLFRKSGPKISAAGNSHYVLGTTDTGIGDAFSQFDFLGSLFFLLIGRFMKRVWFTTQSTHHPVLQSMYSILLIECLISLTHGTTYFLPGFITLYVFIYIASTYSRTIEAE